MNNYNYGCHNTGLQRRNSCDSTVCRAFQETTDNCSCNRAWFPVNTSLAMAYVPFQQSGEIYECERALSRGTVFPCLDKPFLKGCCR